jgi:hypothetical protein
VPVLRAQTSPAVLRRAEAQGAAPAKRRAG